jgi:glycosyltransferase involved in cell wall biosynthesis
MSKGKKLIFFMPYMIGGGVEKNLFIISNFLVKKIKSITICTVSESFKKKFDNRIKFLSPKKKFSKNKNVRVNYLICLFLLFNYLRKNKNCVVFSFQANIYCILLCKLLNVRIIVRSNSSPYGWYHNYVKEFFYKKIISLADKVIVNSLEFKKQMSDKFDVKVNCIYNPLDSSKILRNSKKGKTDNFFKNKKKILKIINLGRFTEQKDQITILKAINEIKDRVNFRLIIMGKGDEKNNLLNFINENNLNSKVKIRNFMENPYAIINQSDLFVLSSKYEGLPNVLLEALTLNKFVISTDCPTGPKEILLNGKGGMLFNVGDHTKLAKKIIYYFEKKNKLKKMITTSKKNLFRFDYNSNLNKYYNLIKPFIN